MNQQDLFKEKIQLLKAIYPQQAIVLENLERTFKQAIADVHNQYMENWNEIIKGNPRYYNINNMKKGTAYKLSATIETNLPEDTSVIYVTQ